VAGDVVRLESDLMMWHIVRPRAKRAKRRGVDVARARAFSPTRGYTLVMRYDVRHVANAAYVANVGADAISHS
jgi:hypothetical protein